MRASLKKSIAVSLAALMLASSLAVSATPAAAKTWWPGKGFGMGLGVGLGLGALGGIAASQPAYGYDSCVRYRPTYDQWGNYLGRQAVNVCQ